ncbi:TPA: FUSC family protein [Providencia rettgeri]
MLFSQLSHFLHKNVAGFHRVFPALTLHKWQVHYMFQCCFAAMLALFIAYALDLQMPYSAVATVLLVINPTPGAVLGKGLWRFLGTLAGMLAAFILIGLFSQKPWLFIIGLSIWLGLCVAAMSLQRHFRASGAVVAGYTVGLATYGAMQYPEMAFDHIMERGTTVFIGVLCLSVITIIFNKRLSQERLKKQIEVLCIQVFKQLANKFEKLAQGNVWDKMNDQDILLSIYQLDDLLAMAKSESLPIAYKSIWIRHGISLLANIVVTPLPSYLSSGDYQKISQYWMNLANQETLLERMEELDKLEKLCFENKLTPSLALLKIVEDIKQALNYFSVIDKKETYKLPRDMAFSYSLLNALANGARAAITLFLAGGFWLVSGWEYGDMMLLVLAPYCSLLSTVANPIPGAKAFLRGTLYAIPLAFICSFVILPMINGFPLLIMVLILFWLPGIYATSVPKYGLTGLAYLVAFTVLTDIKNPMTFDFLQFLNWSLAWIVATLFSWTSFLIIFPKNLTQQKIKLSEIILKNTRAAFNNNIVSFNTWQQRQQHRLVLLSNSHLINQSFIYVQLGRVIMQWDEHLTTDDRHIVQPYLSNVAVRLVQPNKALWHMKKINSLLLSKYKNSSFTYIKHYHFIYDIENLLRQLNRT